MFYRDITTICVGREQLLTNNYISTVGSSAMRTRKLHNDRYLITVDQVLRTPELPFKLDFSACTGIPA